LYFLFFLPLLGILPARIASRKGYSFTLWWVYATVLFVFALPHSLLVLSRDRGIDGLSPENARLCPYCAELFPIEDSICPACHLRLCDPMVDGPCLEHGHAEPHDLHLSEM